MKINGEVVDTPNIEIIVIPRGSRKDIVLKAQAVLETFEEIYPPPRPPKVRRPGISEPIPDFSDEDYKKEVEQYAKRRVAWLVINSLKTTDGLEWDTVVFDDPNTWTNYTDDLKNAKFSDTEIARIVDAVATANGMNEAKIAEARNRFLVGMGLL